MIDEKGGFSVSVGGDIKGDVAQTIDKSKHVNVEGDVDTINMGDEPSLEAALVEAGASSEEASENAGIIRKLAESGEAAGPIMDRAKEIISKYGPAVGRIALSMLKATPAGPVIEAVVKELE